MTGLETVLRLPPERVRIKRISEVTRDTLSGFVLDNVARGSEVRTDAWTGYDDIGRFRFSHVVTNVSGSGDPAHVALPHVHIVASLLKRWIFGTHQGSISHHQLDYYLDEFTFRFNRRARHAACSLPPTRGCDRNPPAPLQGPDRQIRRITTPRLGSGERAGYRAPLKGHVGADVKKANPGC